MYQFSSLGRDQSVVVALLDFVEPVSPVAGDSAHERDENHGVEHS